MTTWIITADSSRARILQVMDRDQRVAEVEDFVDADARMVGDYLDKARTDHRFDRLYLMPAPKFLDELRKELGAEVQKLVKDELPKDLSWLDARDIARRYCKG